MSARPRIVITLRGSEGEGNLSNIAAELCLSDWQYP